MSQKEQIGFAWLGFGIWAAGTLVYRVAGAYFFEGSAAAFWLNVIVTVLVCAVLPLELMKWRRIEQTDWLQGAICLSLPGMLGEIPIFADFAELMSNMQPATAGQYAAFLFGCYSCLIGSAWLMSTKATTRSLSGTELMAKK